MPQDYALEITFLSDSFAQISHEFHEYIIYLTKRTENTMHASHTHTSHTSKSTITLNKNYSCIRSIISCHKIDLKVLSEGGREGRKRHSFAHGGGSLAVQQCRIQGRVDLHIVAVTVAR